MNDQERQSPTAPTAPGSAAPGPASTAQEAIDRAARAQDLALTAARADVRRGLLLRGVVNAACVPAAAVLVNVLHVDAHLVQQFVILAWALVVVGIEALLRRAVRARPSAGALGIGVFLGFLSFGIATGQGASQPWFYVGGTLAILAEWWLLARFTRPQEPR